MRSYPLTRDEYQHELAGKQAAMEFLTTTLKILKISKIEKQFKKYRFKKLIVYLKHQIKYC